MYQIAFKAAMKIFELSKRFFCEEKYSLIEQIRRSSRSVCVNLAEAWRERRYKAAFIAKLSDSEAVYHRRRGGREANPLGLVSARIPKGLALKDTAPHKVAEVQVWLKFAVECGYLEIDVGRNLYKDYNRILKSLVNMMNNADKWIL